jgi:hypothetical protein
MRTGRQKIEIVLAALVLTAGLALSPVLAAGKAKTFVGQVSDAMCGAQHMEPGATPADCTRTCVSKGAKYALVVGDKFYTLDGENKAALDELNRLAGQKAKVTGTAKGDTIEVSSVAPAK